MLSCSCSPPSCLWYEPRPYYEGNNITWIRGRSLPARRLPAVGLRDLPHELGPGHVQGAVDGAGLRPRIVLQDFHHQSGVVGEDDAGLQHAQKTGLALGLAEGSGRVDGHIGVEALASRGDGGERRTDFEGDTREDQLLAAGRRDGLSDFWIVERVD